MEQLILNPQSKRYVKFGSANHKRLIREGVLPPVEILQRKAARANTAAENGY